MVDEGELVSWRVGGWWWWWKGWGRLAVDLWLPDGPLLNEMGGRGGVRAGVW